MLKLQLAIVVAIASLVACHDEQALAIARWQLAGEVARQRGEVVLPAHLPIEGRRGTYVLSARVDVPPSWRGQSLTLWLADVSAVVQLRVDGALAPSEAEPERDAYRAIGPLSWPLPAQASRDGKLHLELSIAHRWTQSAWWASAPQITIAGSSPASVRTVRWVNMYLAIAALVSLVQLGLTSLVMYIVDRDRREYLWFAVQVISAAFYPAFVLGITQSWLGVYETPVLGGMLVVAISTSIGFSHVFFQLARPWRGWHWLAVAALAAIAWFANPFESTQVGGAITVGVIAVISCYEVYLCARLSIHHADRLTAKLLLAAWLALTLSLPADLLHWLGIVTLLDGARPASVGLLVYALCLSLLLARQHIRSLRAEAEQRNAQRTELVRLNEELRHQVAERSNQLFAALALAGGPMRAALDIKPGDVLDARYRVVRTLGRGGMGTVHEVERVADGKRLALKLTHEVHGTALARLAREAVIATRVSHSNIVQVVDVSVAEGGYLFIVMELVEGAPLTSQRSQWGDLDWALPVLVQIADGLVALHAVGVVHRDLKPANILAARDGDRTIIKISDFGVSRPTTWSHLPSGTAPKPAEPLVSTASAELGVSRAEAAHPVTPSTPTRRARPPSVTVRLTGSPVIPGVSPPGAPLFGAALHDLADDVHAPDPRSPSVDGVLTKTGMLVGTPPYIPPEMAAPTYTPVASADIFAFGVIAFELCTGERPFAQPPVLAALAGQAPPTPASLASRRPDAPLELVTLLSWCLATDPGLRPTASSVAATLRTLLERRAPGYSLSAAL